VEFFLIQKDVALDKIRAQFAAEGQVLQPGDKAQMLIGQKPSVQAFYIGSDYTYAYSLKFRETVFK